MPRDPRFDVLFEPVSIGPVTANNRFFQVPHCSGMGHLLPRSDAAMRSMKAEGGWAVVCTEQCSFHPHAEAAPYPETKLWDHDDVIRMRHWTDTVHKHGALAGTEIVSNASALANYYSREIPLGPSHTPVTYSPDPVQARAMDLDDIREFRRWHRDGFLRARDAGFDLAYVYCGHDIAMPMDFLSRRRNRRTDGYGGSLENRVRLLRELLEDTLKAVGGSMAIGLRFATDELVGKDGITWEDEGCKVIEMLADLPDFWDVNVSDWTHDSASSRFSSEGYQEPYIAFVKGIVKKPVVSVGRFTSPETMRSLIVRGIADFVGCARPSIADPFIPRKIDEGRLDDIRECIGCNICVTGQHTATPMRCTQNPTVGEEWRRGWHPERIEPKGSDSSVLVVGAGPAGLECALALGQRGYRVGLAEASRELGGRVSDESALPGLAEWARVRDYRTYQIEKLHDVVEVFRESEMTAETVLEAGYQHVAVATGSRWRQDGIGRANTVAAIPGSDAAHVLTPNDLFTGTVPASPVVVFDDDHFYMGGVIAEKLVNEGLSVILVTPGSVVSSYAEQALEQEGIQSNLVKIGVQIVTGHNLTQIDAGGVQVEGVYGEGVRSIECASVVMVTSRLPNDALYYALKGSPERLADAGIQSLKRIGDAHGPGLIAAAVWSGHRFARELDAPPPGDVPFKRELVVV